MASKHGDKQQALDTGEVGYVGRVWDDTPNDHYTVAGQLAGKPVPETQPLAEAGLPPLAGHPVVDVVDEEKAKAEAEVNAAQEAAANRESLRPQVGRESVDSK